jgi:plastocyanin
MISRLLIFITVVSIASCSQKHQPASHAVHIKNMKFDPAEINVAAGDTITWTNDDMVDHDITENNKAWSSGALNTGKSWSRVMTAGTDYYCSIHVVMKGKIRVN